MYLFDPFIFNRTATDVMNSCQDRFQFKINEVVYAFVVWI